MLPFVAPLLIGAGGSLLNSLLGGNKQKQTTNQNSTTTGSSSSMPTFDPRFQPLLQTLLNRTGSNFNRGSFLPQGFQTNAIEQINAANKGAQTNLDASLAARGLGTSPVAAAAQAGLQQQRQAQIGDLGVQLPMIERQMQQEDLASLMATLGLGRGVNQTSTSRTTGTGTTTGQAGGPLNDIGGLLGYLYASGVFGGGGAPTSAGQPVGPGYQMSPLYPTR